MVNVCAATVHVENRGVRVIAELGRDAEAFSVPMTLVEEQFNVESTVPEPSLMRMRVAPVDAVNGRGPLLVHVVALAADERAPALSIARTNTNAVRTSLVAMLSSSSGMARDQTRARFGGDLHRSPLGKVDD
jgi:hypothetical protein